MLALLMIVASFMLVGLVCLIFVAWALREHGIANQYRKLAGELQEHIKNNPPQAPNSGWTVTYKIGKAIKTQSVPGKTEGEALLNFSKTIAHDNIISITR